MGGRLFEYVGESGNIKGAPKVLLIIYGISDVPSHGKEIQQVDLRLVAHLGIISAFCIVYGAGCRQKPVPIK